jgi:DNA-binding ferritin-like protein (Dps family)
MFGEFYQDLYFFHWKMKKNLKKIRNFLSDQTEKLPKNLKKGYKNFLSYVYKFYFSKKAVFLLDIIYITT